MRHNVHEPLPNIVTSVEPWMHKQQSRHNRSLQDRLEELRKKGAAGDRHDSTLGGFDEQGTAEERAGKASEHLKKFLSGLDKLKQQGHQVPGLDGLEDLLKDPRKGGPPPPCTPHIVTCLC